MLFGNANPQVESTISRGIPKFGGWLVHSLSLSFGPPHRGCAEDMAWLVSLWLQANNKTKHLGVLIGRIWAKESGGWRWCDLWHRGLTFQTMGYVVSSVLGGMLSHQATGIITGFSYYWAIKTCSRFKWCQQRGPDRKVSRTIRYCSWQSWENESSMAIAVACQHVCALGETPNPMSHTLQVRNTGRGTSQRSDFLGGSTRTKNSVSHLGNVHKSHI